MRQCGNILETGRPQMTIWRTRIACWKPKTANTLGICDTYFFSLATMVARTPLSGTLNVHWAQRCVTRTLPLVLQLFCSLIETVTKYLCITARTLA